MRATEIARFEARAAGSGQIVQAIREQVHLHRRAGDHLGAGEWNAAAFLFLTDAQIDEAVAQVISSWSSPLGAVQDFHDLTTLAAERAVFVDEDLAAAIGAVSLRLQEYERPVPTALSDLAFKLRPALEGLFEFKANRKEELCPRAAASLAAARASVVSAADSFCNTTPATAKEASVALIKAAKALQKRSVIVERPLLSEIPLLVGAEFRKLCEDYQRDRTEGVLRRSPAIRSHIGSLSNRADEWGGARLWRDLLSPVSAKVVDLVEEILAGAQAATTPQLGLVSSLFKLDLLSRGQPAGIVARLRNSGSGRAKEVSLSVGDKVEGVRLTLTEPQPPFDLAGQSEQLIRVGVEASGDSDSLRVPIRWHFETLTGERGIQDDVIHLLQQIDQPDWDRLRRDPPYSHNPVQVRDKLYGRDALLESLVLHAMARNSCFVWGQKRIGKTSLLQVLEKEIRRESNVACVYLRMGEIKGLHEGQLAHRIAERFAAALFLPVGAVPDEATFGATMARLIPWVDEVVQTQEGVRLVLIVDEFDDLDPSYYTGERGEQFIKQLRSLSEVGLTFFLAGSERMGAIYQRHQNELNKWTNAHLDSIASRADCRELVLNPVLGSIEFDDASVDEIVDYCAGNPFYMHLLCFALFQLCMREQKTYVGLTDVSDAKERLMRTSGETNFAHFWSDNPTLSKPEHERLAAECCLLLTLISRVGGGFETTQDLLDAQRELGLAQPESLTRAEMDQVVAALAKRRLLSRAPAGGYEIVLPIFREWLARQADTELLAKWLSYCAQRAHTDEPVARQRSARTAAFAAPTFPIEEDDLLILAQQLTYQGKQTDVARLRTWLAQFDDEVRVELAYLMLKRLVEAGYVSDGAYAQKLQKLVDTVREKRRTTGGGSWRELRGRRDDLAIAFVDGELKSGGSLARALKNRLRPGKVGPAGDLGAWLRGHHDKDALLLVTDDFAASGASIVKGLTVLHETFPELVGGMAAEGRILCYLLYAMPEALDAVHEAFPGVEIACMHCFGDEVRALSPEAEIFESDDERRFAEEMLVQLGRELFPKFPLGWQNMGLLVAFQDTIPNNTLPVFWNSGTVAERPWKPLLPRA